MPEVSDEDQLTNTSLQRAAIILSMLGPAEAREICRRMDSFTANRLIAQLKRLGDVEPRKRTAVGREAITRVENPDATPDTLAEELTQDILGRTGRLGELSQNAIENSLQQLGRLDKMDPETLWHALQNETPQAIAFAMKYLSPANCAKLLSAMPQSVHEQVVSGLMAAQPPTHIALNAYVRAIDQLVERGIGEGGQSQDNTEFVADIVQQLDRNTGDQVMQIVGAKDPNMKARVENLVFNFTDMLQLPPKPLQMVLQNSSTNDLAMALKGVEEEMREAVFDNLSDRAATVLREEIELLGAIPVSDAQQAQLKIVQIARKLEEAGEVSLRTEDVEYIE